MIIVVVVVVVIIVVVVVAVVQWQIIPLLTQAISHLKSYSCERLITFLKVLTADEYYQVRDYEKSFVYV